jgi:hypothetical protein
VDDLHVNARALAELDRFRDRVEHAVRLVAQMGKVGRAACLQDLAEFDELLAFGVRSGRREQARRHAVGAGVERFDQQPFHVVELVGFGRAVLHPHGHQAKRVVTDQHDAVDRGRRIGPDVVGEGGIDEVEPWRARPQILGERFGLSRQCRRAAEAAMADHLGRDALADFAFRQRHQRQRPVGVGLDVDEAGGDDFVPGVDHARAAGRDIRIDGDDLAVPQRDVGHATLGTCAVHNQSAPDQYLFRHAQLVSRFRYFDAPL